MKPPLEGASRTMRFNLHQHLALGWVLGAPWVFAPVLASAKRPDAGAVLAWGIAIVAVMILAVPVLLRSSVFRRWYGWTDALSQRQLHALAQRNRHLYYEVASNDGYVSRVTPYAWRLIWATATLLAPSMLLSDATGIPVLDALLLFPMWYPLGALVLLFASCPIGRLLETRRNGRP